jgi:saccharopine dehydrogenase-like NADP-dependent oxidoreductase
MLCVGKDDVYTAMAKTVGLPLAISALLLLNNKINLTGIQIPTNRKIYIQVLKELEKYGVTFNEYSNEK